MITVGECLLADFTCKKYDRSSSILVGRFENKYFFVAAEELVEGNAESKWEIGLEDPVTEIDAKFGSAKNVADAVAGYWAIDETYENTADGNLAYDRCVDYVMKLVSTLKADDTPPQIDLGKFRGPKQY